VGAAARQGGEVTSGDKRGGRQLFTLFQVSSGDGWVQTVVRPMIREQMDGDGEDRDISSSMLPVLFFISYYIIISIVLFNIVVAILLDGSLSSPSTC